VIQHVELLSQAFQIFARILQQSFVSIRITHATTTTNNNKPFTDPFSKKT